MEDLDKKVPKNKASLNLKQKSVLSIHFIACIIVYVLRLRSIYSSIENIDKGNTMNKVIQIKDFSSFVFDLMTMNVSSMLMNSTTYFDNLKNVFSFAKNKIKVIREKLKTNKCNDSECFADLSSLKYDSFVDKVFENKNEKN